MTKLSQQLKLKKEAVEDCIRICEAGMDGTHEKYAEGCRTCAMLIKEQFKEILDKSY